MEERSDLAVKGEVRLHKQVHELNEHVHGLLGVLLVGQVDTGQQVQVEALDGALSLLGGGGQFQNVLLEANECRAKVEAVLLLCDFGHVFLERFELLFVILGVPLGLSVFVGVLGLGLEGEGELGAVKVDVVDGG